MRLHQQMRVIKESAQFSREDVMQALAERALKSFPQLGRVLFMDVFDEEDETFIALHFERPDHPALSKEGAGG